MDKCRIGGLKKKSKGNFGSKVNLSKDALLDLLKQTRPGLHLEPKVLMRDCDTDICAVAAREIYVSYKKYREIS